MLCDLRHVSLPVSLSVGLGVFCIFGAGCSDETRPSLKGDAALDSTGLVFADAMESSPSPRDDKGGPHSRCGDPCSNSEVLCKDIIASAAAREEAVDYEVSRKLYVIPELDSDAGGHLRIVKESVLNDKNPCFLIKDPKVINTQVFNVRDYGAIGDGSSHRLGSRKIDVFWPPKGHACAATHRDAIAFLETQLTRVFPEKTLKSHYRKGLIQKRPERPAGFSAKDEYDWVGIQGALLAAGEAGGGTVVIPDTGAEYLCNRQLWVPSNVRMLWLTVEDHQMHSFLRMTERSEIVGAFVASYNEFDDARKTVNWRNFVCRLRFSNPRLRTLPGENAMGFALGAFDVQIVGGELEGALWGGPDEFALGFNERGGKAIQFEAGFMRAVIRDTILRDSSMGINATTTFPIGSCAASSAPACDANKVQFKFGSACACTARHPKTYFQAASHVHVSGVITERVQAPLSVFYVAMWSRFVSASDRALLERVSPQSDMRFSNIVIREPVPWSGFISLPYAGAKKGDYAGILNLTNAIHVTLEGKNSVEASTYAPTLVRGNGRDIHIGGVIVKGLIGRLLDGRFPYGRNGSYPQVEDVEIRDVTAAGVKHALVHVPGKPNASHRVFSKTVVSDNHLGLVSSIPDVEGPMLESGEVGYEASELKPPYLTIKR